MKLKKIIIDGQEIELGGSGDSGAYVEGDTLYLNSSEGGSSNGSVSVGGSSLNKTTITIPITTPIDTTTGTYPITDSTILSDILTMYNNANNIVFGKYALKMGMEGVLNIGNHGNLMYDIVLTPDTSVFQIFLPTHITSHNVNGVVTSFSLTGTSAAYDIINNSLTILCSEGDFETYNQMIDSGVSVNIIIEYYTLK